MATVSQTISTSNSSQDNEPTEQLPQMPKNLVDSIWSNFGSNQLQTKEIFGGDDITPSFEEHKSSFSVFLNDANKELNVQKSASQIQETEWFNAVKPEIASFGVGKPSYSCFSAQSGALHMDTLKSELNELSKSEECKLTSEDIELFNVSEPSLSCSENEEDEVEEEDEDDYEPFLSPKALRDLEIAACPSPKIEIFEVFDEEEPKPAPEPLRIDGPKEDAKCWAFNSEKGCINGKFCRWKHEKYETGQGTGFNICWAFDSKQGCKKGFRCKWLHRRHPNSYNRTAYR